MNELIEKIQQARFIWICGNGGSAATSDHFTTDLVKKGYRAISLNSNNSLITMLANDYGYERTFSEQLKILGNHSDLLITISCSGTSKNIIKVLEVASMIFMRVYSFEVFGNEKDYGKLEDKHLKLIHEVVSKL